MHRVSGTYANILQPNFIEFTSLFQKWRASMKNTEYLITVCTVHHISRAHIWSGIMFGYIYFIVMSMKSDLGMYCSAGIMLSQLIGV